MSSSRWSFGVKLCWKLLTQPSSSVIPSLFHTFVVLVLLASPPQQTLLCRSVATRRYQTDSRYEAEETEKRRLARLQENEAGSASSLNVISSHSQVL